MYLAMFKNAPLWRRLAVLCLLVGIKPAFASSVPSDAQWRQWFLAQVQQHPTMTAAAQRRDAVISQAANQDRALYNPEFDSSLERKGQDTNFRLGLNQSIDLWDKRGSRQEQAQVMRDGAKQDYAQALQEQIRDSLYALIDWQAAKQTADLALDQERRLGDLIHLLQRRQQAGDVGRVDADLAYLNLSQGINITAQALALQVQLQAGLQQILPQWQQSSGVAPDVLWQFEPTAALGEDEMAQQHPQVMAAKARWQAQNFQAQLAQRQTRADPTLGINAGREDQEAVVALSFSIPLQIRNNYSDAARAANQQALAREADYLAIYRQQRFAIKAARGVLDVYQVRYKQWQALIQGRAEHSGSLLQQQWTNGDLSTAVYLQALQQRSLGLVAGIALQRQYYRARLDYLYQSAQLNSALKGLEANTESEL